MKQLALNLKLADYARFDTFFPGPNAALLHAVEQAATVSGLQVHWIWGARGTGRTHLLQAAVAAAGQQGMRCAWVPLSPEEGLNPLMLEGMGALDLLCVDDVDAIAGDADWERQLFRVFEELRGGHGRLLVTASTVPAEAGFSLPDLASRLASGPTWKVRSMNDDELLASLQLRSKWRGLELPEETGRFLLRRVERSPAVLFALLDKLDEAALVEQRGLTVPLVKSVLENMP